MKLGLAKAMEKKWVRVEKVAVAEPAEAQPGEGGIAGNASKAARTAPVCRRSKIKIKYTFTSAFYNFHLKCS